MNVAHNGKREYPMLFHPNSCAGKAHSVLGSEETIKPKSRLGC